MSELLIIKLCVIHNSDESILHENALLFLSNTTYIPVITEAEGQPVLIFNKTLVYLTVRDEAETEKEGQERKKSQRNLQQ